MWKSFFTIVVIVFVFSSPRPVFGQQAECEKKILQDFKAEEVLRGPEYEILLTVATAFGFGRGSVPRLYFIPGDGNAAYIVGSVISDGRGKILMSLAFAKFIGNTSALKGVLAHEVAHSVLDKGEAGCNDWITLDIEIEKAADVLAASKVGFDAVRDSLLKEIELRGGSVGWEIALRLQHLQAVEELEVQEDRQR